MHSNRKPVARIRPKIRTIVRRPKLPCSENLRVSSWSYDVKGHAKKCVERYCEFANRTTQRLYKVSTPCIEKYKGRVVLRGDIAKDDSGSYAVFAENGSSASQITAAKVMDIISRLRGCAGQEADAVSAYTQVKMEDAPTLLKSSKAECPDIWIRLPKHKWSKSWSLQSINSMH